MWPTEEESSRNRSVTHTLSARCHNLPPPADIINRPTHFIDCPSVVVCMHIPSGIGEHILPNAKCSFARGLMTASIDLPIFASVIFSIFLALWFACAFLQASACTFRLASCAPFSEPASLASSTVLTKITCIV